MKIDLVPYEPAHAYDIIHRNVIEQNLWLSEFPDWEKWAKGWQEQGPAYTLIIDNQIVGSAGVILQEWQRGEAWMLISTLFYKYPKTTFKVIKHTLRKIIKEHDLRRVQSLIAPHIETHQRFIERLGFRHEGLMRAYGPRGENYLMYSRITENGRSSNPSNYSS